MSGRSPGAAGIRVTALFALAAPCAVVLSCVESAPPEESADAAPRRAHPPRVDLYGDPLPEGAIARCGTVRFVQPGFRASSVSYSRDGRLLASADLKTLLVWDAATGKLLRGLSTRVEEGVYSWFLPGLAFSPDSRLVACGCGHNATQVWEVSTGRRLLLLQAFPNSRETDVHSTDGGAVRTDLGYAVTGVAFAPDGKTLATAATDDSVRLWDLSTGVEIWRHGFRQSCAAVAFSPDGSDLAAAGLGGPCLIDPATGAERGKSSAQGPYVYSLCFSPDGKRIATSHHDNVCLWDAATLARLATFEGPKAQVWAAAFSPDGKRIASGGDDGAVHVWDIEAGAEALRIEEHNGSVQAIAYSPDGRTLAVGFGNRRVCLYDAAEGRPVTVGHVRTVTHVAFSRDGSKLASASLFTDNSVRVWDVASGRQIATHTVPMSFEPAVSFTPSGSVRACGVKAHPAGSRYWDVWFLDTSDAGDVAFFSGHTERIKCIAISPGGKLMASSGHDGTIRIRDLDERKDLRTLGGDLGKVLALDWSGDGRLLASAGEEDCVRLWDATAGELLARFAVPECDLSTVAVSRDGDFLAAAGGTKVLLWAVPPYATAPSSRAGRGRGGPVAPLRSIEGHASSISSVGFSPAGDILASSGADGTIRLWSVETGGELARVSAHGGPVSTVAFSPDGKLLASGGADTTVLIWDVARLLPQR